MKIVRLINIYENLENTILQLVSRKLSAIFSKDLKMKYLIF